MQTSVPPQPAESIHLIPVRLIADPESLAAARTLLSGEEQRQATNLQRQELSDRFVLTRAVLRRLLSAYLCTSAAHSLEIVHGPFGKPHLRGPARLRFNLAHSGCMALYAFGLDVEVGVDIERLRPVPRAEGIARRFFSTEDRGRVQRATGDDRERQFFLCWTQLEAGVKALGGSLEDLLCDSPRRTAKEAMVLHRIACIPGYAGVLAYPGPDRSVRTWPIQEAADLFTTAGITSPSSTPIPES